MVQRSAESLGQDGMSEDDERLRSVPVCVVLSVCVLAHSLCMYYLQGLSISRERGSTKQVSQTNARKEVS